ncbi:hypothetical protein ACMFMG_010901 [Clarireedia jacksonii]
MKLHNTIYALLGLITLGAAAPISLDLDDFVANAWSRLAAVEDLDPTTQEFRVTDLVRD